MTTKGHVTAIEKWRAVKPALRKGVVRFLRATAVSIGRRDEHEAMRDAAAVLEQTRVSDFELPEITAEDARDVFIAMRHAVYGDRPQPELGARLEVLGKKLIEHARTPKPLAESAPEPEMPWEDEGDAMPGAGTVLDDHVVDRTLLDVQDPGLPQEGAVWGLDENMMCPHGRYGAIMCPHCMGRVA